MKSMVVVPRVFGFLGLGMVSVEGAGFSVVFEGFFVMLV